MAIVEETYLRAAKERAAEAFHLHEAGYYVLAHYVAGLAVECMLRAYKVRDDPQFDSRHDLKELSRAARFFDFVPTRRDAHIETNAALSAVVQRWTNSHRYRDEKELLHWLNEARIHLRVKGDRLRHSSHQIVDAAQKVVAMGDRRWNSQRH